MSYSDEFSNCDYDDEEDWDDDPYYYDDECDDYEDEDDDECDEDCSICYPKEEVKKAETKMSIVKTTAKQFIPHIISGNSITVFTDTSGAKVFPNTHLFYKEICDAVKAGDRVKLEAVLKPQNRNGLEVLEDEVLWNGESLNTVAVTRLFEIKAAGFDTTPIINFLKNCQLNPFPDIVEKLYEFLESRGMPLTEDGCFLGYKYTDDQYWDCYTGKTYRFLPHTRVVATNAENRGKICDLSGEECSGQGIHVGNFSYSGSYANVVYVKVNPKHVLSVPHGYNAQKIRVWELDVLNRTDGKMHDGLVVKENGEDIQFIIGNELNCLYKDGNNKTRKFDGTILNVGNTYLELDSGYYEYSNGLKLKPNSKKIRLKIANILEVL